MFNLSIRQVNNGYILTSEDGEELIEDENEFDEKKTMIRLLERVSDYFGVGYDRWGKENLNIQFNKKGSKYND